MTVATVLAAVFTAGLGAAVTVGVVPNEATSVVEARFLAAVDVVTTGAEFTNTGSVEGIGLPSLVCSFTTFT